MSVADRPVQNSDIPQKLPIFILDATLPNQHLHLNVFEPRYVIMVKRAVESGSRCFGMAWSSSAERGVEVEITSCAEQWDGRYHVEVVGRRPFKVVSSVVAPEGYLEGDVTYFDMAAGAEEDVGAGHVDSNAVEELLPLLEEWEKAVQEGGFQRRPGHLAYVKDHLGPMPRTDQPGPLAAWLC